MMGKVSSRAALVGAVVVVGLMASGCGQVGMLKGKMAFRDANTLYKGQDYRAAAAKYEEAIGQDPDLVNAYFFLGNSYDNLYRPARRGEPANDELMTKAISNYQISAQREPECAPPAENATGPAPPCIKRLALQYLVNAYGPDKLNDPAQQEPILRKMIEMDPSDPANYFVLANVYEQNGDYEQAEQLLLKAREVRPGDSSVYTTLAGFYNRQGEFDKTMEALHTRAQKEPTNPEAFYMIATFYWEKAYRDFTTPEAQKVKFVAEGLEAVDKAIEIKPDYFEALTYKNLLLRVQATLEKSPARQQELLRQANQFRDRAQEVQKKQQKTGAAG
jgi:tetratricopeptide (TPR) repeat protein